MKTKRFHRLLTTVVLCLSCVATVHGQQKSLAERADETLKSTSIDVTVVGKTRDISIEKIDNDNADFAVLVEVDKANYVERDTLTARLKSSRDGYVYMIHISSTGKETMLIPNEYQKDNRIKAMQVVEYPNKDAKDDDFLFRIVGPNFGRETIKVIVTDRKLESIELQKYTRAPLKSLEDADSKSLLDELNKSKDIEIERIERQSTNRTETEEPVTVKPGNELRFATHQVSFTTHPQSQVPIRSSEVQRFYVGIAINKYRDSKINNLTVCVNDAQALAELMMKHCGVPEKSCVILIDEKATLENLKKLFCEILPAVAPPGSEIIFFWSGHGGRMASTRSDTSTKGYASYLVPHDGDTKNPENTMIMEGPFGKWVQNLNGRKLFFIIDACHAGGMTQRAKSIDVADNSYVATGEPTLKGLVDDMTGESESGSKSLNDDPKEFVDFMFGFSGFACSKALGQKDLAVLASSSYNQLSWERQEGDLSVMTHYLIKAIEDGKRGMTHKDIKPIIRQAVNEYVIKNHPNTRQTVVDQDELTPGMILKP